MHHFNQRSRGRRPMRSMLFVPGNKPALFAKMDRFNPDAVLFDLEDAVPPNEKAIARQQVCEAIRGMSGSGKQLYVRINALQEGGGDDISGIVAPGLSGLVIPKAEHERELALLDRAVSYEEGRQGMPLGSVRFLPLPETAFGINNADALARASDRVDGLVGVINDSVAGDVARAIGLHPTPEGGEQSYISSRIVLSSRASGASRPMASLIGMRLDDLEAVRRLACRAKSFGYVGALVIHPAHIAVVHEVFSLSAEETEFLAGMVAAFDEASRAGDGAISFRGTMVDIAMVRYAQDRLDAYAAD